MAPDARTVAFEVGNLLFGSALRLEVATWIASKTEPIFYADQFCGDTGHYSTGIAKVVVRFIKLGMVEKVPQAPLAQGQTAAGRCVYYKRLEHPLWDVIRAAGAFVAGGSPLVQPSAKDLVKARAQLVAMELELR